LGNIFLLFLIILVSLVLYSFQKEALLKNINNELLNTNNAIANMISTSARTTVKNYLRAISEKNLELTQYYYDEYKSGRLSLAKSQDIIKNIFLNQIIGKTGYVYIIDSRGSVVFHPQKELIGTSLASYDFIKYQIKNKTGYSEYTWKNPDEKSEREKTAYTEYFAPFDWIISVSSYRNEFINLINPSDFRDDVLSIKFGKTGYPFVLDLKGNIVIHPQVTGNWYNAVDSRGKYYVREICKKKTGQIYYLNP
jgi:signal transduction histidine kinase